MVSAAGPAHPGMEGSGMRGAGTSAAWQQRQRPQEVRDPAAVATGPGSNVPLPPPKELTLSSMRLLERGSRALLYRRPLVNVKGRFTLQAANPSPVPGQTLWQSAEPNTAALPLLDPCVQCIDCTQHLQLCRAPSRLLRSGIDAPCHLLMETGLLRAS